MNAIAGHNDSAGGKMSGGGMGTAGNGGVVGHTPGGDTSMAGDTTTSMAGNATSGGGAGGDTTSGAGGEGGAGCTDGAQCPTPADPCLIATCDNGTCGTAAGNNGAACNDSDACTQTDKCQAGTCQGTNPVACATPGVCHVAGTCNPQNGQCSNPAADDGTACELAAKAGTCQGGACAVCGNGITEGNEGCDDNNTTPCDGCSPKCQLDTTLTYASASGLALPIPDDGYNGTIASMACVNVTVTKSGDDVVDYVCPTLAAAHTWLGDLTIKLVSPANTVVTLMSLAGVMEAADNGVAATGDSSNLLATFPITWKDGAAKSAETMGNTITNAGVVCKDDAACVYDPNAGAAVAGKLAAFIGQAGPGTWKLCVGDSGLGDTGTVDQVRLVIGQ